MGRRGDNRVSGFVDTLVATAVAEIEGAKLAEGDGAIEVAQRIARRMVDQYAKTSFYVPHNVQLLLAERDAAVWDAYATDSETARKFTGDRLREVAKQFGVTERHAYSLVAYARRQRRGKAGDC